MIDYLLAGIMSVISFLKIHILATAISFASTMSLIWTAYLIYRQFPKIAISNVSFPNNKSKGRIINLWIRFNIINYSNVRISLNRVFMGNKLLGQLDIFEISHGSQKLSSLPPNTELLLEGYIRENESVNNNYSMLLEDQTYKMIIDAPFMFIFRPECEFKARFT